MALILCLERKRQALTFDLRGEGVYPDCRTRWHADHNNAFEIVAAG
jgi:hypothetical protein